MFVVYSEPYAPLPNPPLKHLLQHRHRPTYSPRTPRCPRSNPMVGCKHNMVSRDRYL